MHKENKDYVEEVGEYKEIELHEEDKYDVEEVEEEKEVHDED